MFNQNEDPKKVMCYKLMWDSSFLLPQPWSPLFDSTNERGRIIPVWVKLPRLPLEWWLEEGLKAIGNCLSGTLAMDEGFKQSTSHNVAKFLINIRVHGFLYESIDTQAIDYINIPIDVSIVIKWDISLRTAR